MTQRIVSDCCDALTKNGTCQDCKEKCGTYNEFECATCEDTGEVDTMEQVYPNEPHTAPIGTGPCPDCMGDADDDGELDQDR